MNIIKTLYHEVYTLRDWFEKYPIQSSNANIWQAADSDSFTRFLDTTLVALSRGAKRLSAAPTLSQNSHQREIIMRVIERLNRREGSGQNVLSLGFGQVSDDPDAYMSNVARVEYRHPNSAVNRLHFPEWKKVLSRIGDTMMEHLLETTSIFTFVPPSNYVQLTGKPVFELWKPGLAVKCPQKVNPIKSSKRKRHAPLIKHLSTDTSSTQTLKHCIAIDMEDLKAKAKTYARDQGFPEDLPRKKKQNQQKDKAMDLISDVKNTEERFVDKIEPEQGASAMSQVFIVDKFDMKDEYYGNWDGDFHGNQGVDFDEIQEEDINVNEEDFGNQEEDFNQNQECDDQRRLRPRNVSKKEKRKRGRQRSREKKAQAWIQKIQSGEHESGASPGQIRTSFGSSKKERRKMQRFERRLAKSTALADDHAKRRCISDVSCNQPDIEGQNDCMAFSSGWKRRKQEVTNEENKPSTSSPTPQSSLGRMPQGRQPHTAGPSQQFYSSRPQGRQPHTAEPSQQFPPSRPQGRQPHSAGPSQQFPPSRPQGRQPHTAEPSHQFYSSRPQGRQPHTAGPSQQFHPSRPQGRQPHSAGPSQQFPPSRPQGRQPHTAEPSHQFYSSRPQGRQPHTAEPSQQFPPSRPQGKQPHTAGPSQQFPPSRPQGRQPHTTGPSQQFNSSRPQGRQPDTSDSTQQFGFYKPQSHQFSSSGFQWRNPNTSETPKQFHSSMLQWTQPNTSEQSQQVGSSCPQWRNPNIPEPSQHVGSSRPQWRNPNSSEPPQQVGLSMPQSSFEEVHQRQPTTSQSSQQRSHTRENRKNRRKMKLARRIQRRNETRENQGNASGTGDNFAEEEPAGSGSESGQGDNTTEGPSSFKYRCFPRKSIFCSRELLEQIPKSYILNRLSQDEIGAEELFQEIFQEVQTDQQTVQYRTKVLPALEKMLKLHKNNSYLRQLNYSCTGQYQQCKMGVRGKGVIVAARERIRKLSYGKQGPIWMNQRKTGKRQYRKVSTKRILSQHLGINEVYMFLRRVFLHVIPNELLGNANKKMLQRCFKPFLKLGKYDKFSMAELNVEKMKVEKVLWLAGIASKPEQIHLLSQVVYWIFKDYIMVLLRSFLYITETAHHRNHLLHFRKRDWLRLHMRGLNTLLNKKMMVPVTKTEALKQLSEGDTLGISSLRFLPKMKSLRPIVNLGRRPPLGCKQTIPINKQLLNLLNILSYHKEKNPALVGSAIFGLDKVYPLWKQFASQYQHRGQERSDVKQLYFVKVDIATCFEDIDQEKLFSIIKDIIQKDDDYQIRKYVTMHVAGGQVKRNFKRKASTLLEFNPNFTNFVKERVEKDSLTNIIFVDQVVTQAESSVHLLQQLKSHLSNNLVKVGQRYYLQASGISQGSVLSTILCNMYYGHMEKKLFPVREGEELLIRIVDDSLFVTSHMNRAIDFLSLMYKGIPDYNLRVNTDKVLLNFPLVLDDNAAFPVTQTDWFPWCGMLFNTQTLQTSMDFSRYAGISVADTMSFDLSRDPLMTLKHKLLNALKPKSHIIYMDTELNTTEIVVTNIFKIFVLNALKFHSYQRRLPHKLHLTYQKKFFIELLLDLGSYFFHQTLTCLTKKSLSPGVFNIYKDVVLWICLKGFLVVLQKNGSGWQYKDFRKALNQEHRTISARLELQEKGLSDVLLRVCGEQVPDEFLDLIP